MARRRWVYTEGGKPLPEPIEVSEDWSNTVRRVDVVTDLYMDGVAATDGTDIGSRKKRRAYMQAHGLADADDFKGEWAKADRERQAMRHGNFDTRERKEAIARALTQGKRR